MTEKEIKALAQEVRREIYFGFRIRSEAEDQVIVEKLIKEALNRAAEHDD